MQYYSDDRQDEFVANILKFKKNGYYLDIGSSAHIGSNNTYFFEKELNWKGICIEKNPVFNEGYGTRTCKYYNVDALEVDYEKILEENDAPLSIDYLSIDIDEQSTEVLKMLPDTYRFKVITIEHDGHYYGELYTKPQREILLYKNYFLLCREVLNQSGKNIGQDHGFEDWWVDPFFFTRNELDKLYSYRLDTEQIIKKFTAWQQ